MILYLWSYLVYTIQGNLIYTLLLLFQRYLRFPKNYYDRKGKKKQKIRYIPIIEIISHILLKETEVIRKKWSMIRKELEKERKKSKSNFIILAQIWKIYNLSQIWYFGKFQRAMFISFPKKDNLILVVLEGKLCNINF